MAVFIAIDREWSMTWFSMIHDVVDLGDPDCIEALYDMTADYIDLVCHHHVRDTYPSKMWNMARDVLCAHAVDSELIDLCTDMWYRLAADVRPLLLTHYQSEVTPPFYLTPVIDDDGRLSGLCLNNA